MPLLDLIHPMFQTSYHGTTLPGGKAIRERGAIAPGVTEEGTREVDLKAEDNKRVFLAPGSPRYDYPCYFRFDTLALINAGAGLRPVDLIEDYHYAKTGKAVRDFRDRYTFYGDDAFLLLALASLGLAADDVEYWEIPRERWTSQEARQHSGEIERAFRERIKQPGIEPPRGLRTQYLQAFGLDTEDRRERLAKSPAWKSGDWPELYEKFRIPPPDAVHDGLEYDRMALWYEVRPPFLELVWNGPLELDPEIGYLGEGLDLPFERPSWLKSECVR